MKQHAKDRYLVYLSFLSRRRFLFPKCLSPQARQGKEGRDLGRRGEGRGGGKRLTDISFSYFSRSSTARTSRDQHRHRHRRRQRDRRGTSAAAHHIAYPNLNNASPHPFSRASCLGRNQGQHLLSHPHLLPSALQLTRLGRPGSQPATVPWSLWMSSFKTTTRDTDTDTETETETKGRCGRRRMLSSRRRWRRAWPSSSSPSSGLFRATTGSISQGTLTLPTSLASFPRTVASVCVSLASSTALGCCSRWVGGVDANGMRNAKTFA